MIVVKMNDLIMSSSGEPCESFEIPDRRQLDRKIPLVQARCSIRREEQIGTVHLADVSSGGASILIKGVNFAIGDQVELSIVFKDGQVINCGAEIMSQKIHYFHNIVELNQAIYRLSLKFTQALKPVYLEKLLKRPSKEASKSGELRVE